MAKKVTGRTDQGTKKFPGDEEYKKMFAEMVEKDKPQKPSKPKMNVQNVSSAVFGKEGGSNESFKKIHGTISKLAGHVRKAVIRIGVLEKKLVGIEKNIANDGEKITRIKNILKNQKSDIGKKLPGSSQDNLEKTLIETNKLLIKIQSELAKAFASREGDQRKKQDNLKRAQSRRKLQREESQLEKSSKRLGESVAKNADEVVTPVKGIFGKIMDFLGTMVLGIAANAVFEWLKNEENRKKVESWFSWIKDHWKWVAAGIGALALIPLVGAIGSVIGVIGSAVAIIKLAMMPLLALLLNPLFWKAMLIVGAGVLLYKAGESLYKAARGGITGGQKFNAAHDVLDKKMEDAGLVVRGPNAGKEKSRSGRGFTYSDPTDPEKIKVAEEVKMKRKQLNDMRDEMNNEIKTETAKIESSEPTTKGVTMSGQPEMSRAKIEKGIRKKYEEKIFNLVPEVGQPESSAPEKRKMGGPVKAGMPYIVGDQLGMKTAELFVPHVDGTIINNQKTQKVYQNLTSKKRGRGGVNISTLPMITNQLPPPEVQLPSGSATDVPEISSVNMADPYRQLSPMLYGITV
jgi:hypothetical protein